MQRNGPGRAPDARPDGVEPRPGRSAGDLRLARSVHSLRHDVELAHRTTGCRAPMAVRAESAEGDLRALLHRLRPAPRRRGAARLRLREGAGGSHGLRPAGGRRHRSRRTGRRGRHGTEVRPSLSLRAPPLHPHRRAPRRADRLAGRGALRRRVAALPFRFLGAGPGVRSGGRFSLQDIERRRGAAAAPHRSRLQPAAAADSTSWTRWRTESMPSPPAASS